MSFPSEARRRALGEQHSRLPDRAEVCSQHFLRGDVCDTESGAAAVPSAVLVCMICLDTDSKMTPMRTHNLGEVYEKLTGYPLWDGGNLKQTLCVQCAQRLRNFSRLREQSLRARSLMMELLEKHELVTIDHLKMLKHATNQVRNNLVSTTLGPDPCDMYIVENTEEDGQTDSEEPVIVVAVKTECSDDSQSVDEDKQEIKYSDIEEFDEDPLKYESDVFMCTVCSEEFPHEHAYSAHVRMHLHGHAHPAAPSVQSAAILSTNIGNEARATAAIDTTKHSERALVAACRVSDNRACNSDHRTYNDLKCCVVELYDILEYPPDTKIKVESSPQTLQAVSSRHSLNALAACEDAQYRAASEDEVAATHNKPAASVRSETEPGTSGHSSRTHTFTCDVCQHAFTQRYMLVRHLRTHTDEKPYSCEICSSRFTRKGNLVKHIMTHTGEKPYSCEICSFKSRQRHGLMQHMRTHTCEKPYSCKICGYKFRQRSTLTYHMSTHSEEKPYSCKVCSYKCSRKSSLRCHLKTHTGEKPYSCKVCSYKCSRKSSLRRHLKTHTGEKPSSGEMTHTGEKPYSCEICSFKSRQRHGLMEHMRTHTGEKPYSCKICGYKFRHRSTLTYHMTTHSEEKPYSCKLCSYKCSKKSTLSYHLKTHTGEKPYVCEICGYKSSLKNYLYCHMKTHSSEKPYSCKLCSYKCKFKYALKRHLLTHTGERPYSCKLCSYKCSRKFSLRCHLKTHTGERPYSCEICSSRFAQKGTLDKHIMTHTGEKPYSCKICSYKCRKSSTLTLHNMRKHSGERPYSCKLQIVKTTIH